MAEGHYDIGVERWTCSVSNQHRKAYGDRKIRQRTVMRLEGSVATAAGPVADVTVSVSVDHEFLGDLRIVLEHGGRSVVRARDEAIAKDVTINGLPILAVEPYLDQYFRDYVIGGPGAFMIVAKDFESFGEAIVKKMIIEIAANEQRPAQRRRVN